MNIGVLAVQGSFYEHQRSLDRIGVTHCQVRTPSELDSVDALILPGGESTTMTKLLKHNGLFEAIQQRVGSGMPAYGTCAGAILLSHHIEGDSHGAAPLDLIDIDVARNAYGSQLDSFETTLTVFNNSVDAVFIRAPQITRVGGSVTILAQHNSLPVLVQSKNILVSTFHPELTEDPFIYNYFCDLISQKK